MIVIKPWMKLLVFLCLLIILSLGVLKTELLNNVRAGNVGEIQEMANDSIISMLLLTFLIMTVQNTFTIIPLIVVLTINIAFWGFLNGVIWSWFSSIVASAIVFLSVRYLFKEMVTNKINQEFKEKIEKKGFMYVFIARIFPFFPTSIVNLISGVSSIKFTHFIIATSIGNFLYFFILALVPLGFLTGEVNSYLLSFIFIVFITTYYIYKKYKRKKIVNNENNKNLTMIFK